MVRYLAGQVVWSVGAIAAVEIASPGLSGDNWRWWAAVACMAFILPLRDAIQEPAK
jgi:hypothetical protein